MKKCTIIIILYLISGSKILFAQPVPVTIQFVEAQPLWEHLVYDTNYFYVGIQPELNKYTTVQPHQSFKFNNDLFISSYCINYNAEIYGYILEKLDFETGQIEWQSYNTYYNNGLQDYYKNLYLRSDGNLEMDGIKRYGPYIDSILSYWNVGGGKSNFVRKVFDYQTGDLLKTVIGHDSIDDIVPSYLNFYPIEVDSTYLALNLIGNEVNGELFYGYDFYKLNSVQNLVDTFPVSTILYETSDSVYNYFAYGQPQYTQKLDDTTMVGLVFQDKLHPGKTKAQLIWMNVKDLDNVTVIKRMNIENMIPGQETSFLYFTFKVENDLIYISQPYKNDQNLYTAYLICLDRYGNLVHNIPACIENNTNYESICLIYSGENFDYFAGSPSRTGRKGLDILRLDRDSDTFQFISSITSAVSDEEFTRQMEVCQLYDNGLFVIGAYTKKLGQVQNSAVKYYCFKGSDLGMELNTAIDQIAENDDIKIYPNPTSGIVNFKIGENISGSIALCDVTGRNIASYQIIRSDAYHINLGDYPNGMYYASILNSKTGVKHISKIILSAGF